MQGPESMTVADANALLYKPGHPADRLERALRIPALGAGWRGSFMRLLEQARSSPPMTGNAGLALAGGPKPAWSGFRPLRVTRKTRESNNVTSIRLEPSDGRSLSAALPGQFVVLRLRRAPDAPPIWPAIRSRASRARLATASVSNATRGVWPGPISPTRSGPATLSR